MKDIIENLELNRFSYNDIRKNSIVSLINKNEEYDVNVIIGFRGRPEFIKPVADSFNKAIDYYKNVRPEIKICLTFVEHDIESKNQDKIDCNYIWTPGNVSDQYSRSFAYNFGVKYSNKSKYYLLHDLDILVKENFFEEVFENLGESKCMQTYGGRRVLYMSDNLTKKVINKEVSIDSFSEKTEEVSLPMYNGVPALGSKGGSIFVEREFYYSIGGFDPELFWGYAAEDQIFWDKCLTKLGEVTYADSPLIDMFHMWHPPSVGTNPLLMEMESYMLQFRNFGKKGRKQYIEIQKQGINE